MSSILLMQLMSTPLPSVQLCAAYRAAKGKTIAVLSSRPKLEMEELFDATIPRSRRYNSRFVFRQVRQRSARNTSSATLQPSAVLVDQTIDSQAFTSALV